MTSTSKALEAFQARTDLAEYGSNALLLFALQLRWGIADIDGVAATALTDHANDKKCDLVYVDRDAGRIVVAQGYLATKEVAAAPANKASDLNTAVTWLLSGGLDSLPEALRSAAEEVRDAIEQDQINEFHIWYSHNAPESANVKTELEQAVRTADSTLARYFSEAQIAVAALEIGLGHLEEMYARTEAPIAVSAELELSVPGGFEVVSDRWKAFATAVPGTWLREQWDLYKTDLMSPNVRDYLGIVRSERNINNGIKTTAKTTPENFWIYNNGITVLVHDYEAVGPAADGSYQLKLKGLGIVNGAQTTGSIATLSESDAPNLDRTSVLARFVKCDDPEVLGDIVKYNNTQNKVEAADFRSKDAVQDRMRMEFDGIPDADYRGGRRGGVRDAIERSRNLVPDSAVAQALAAFAIQPNIAYNETRRIWEENAIYSRYFTDRTSARHVVLAYALLRALESTKKRIGDIPESERTEAQKRHMQFFRRRGSIHLLMAAISSSIETFLGIPVPNRTQLQFSANCSPKQGAENWLPVIDVALSFSAQVIDATDNGLKNPETVKKAISTFDSMIEATAEANSECYAVFAGLVEIVSHGAGGAD